MFSLRQCIEFESAANPHAWFLVAYELHEQAVSLMLNSSQSSIVSMRDGDGRELDSWSSNNRTIFLLCGFALENMLKAFLILEHPDYVGEGKLSKEVTHHSLTKLSEASNLVPYKNRAMNTLGYFEDGLESWARYPCGLNWSRTKPQSVLESHMWGNYRWLMRAYEKRFKKLVSKGWRGPHELDGKFIIEGNWLR